MKQISFFALLIAGACTFTACNDSGENTSATGDTTNQTDNSAAVNTNNATEEYSAFADELETNSAQGYYVNPKSGKPYQKLSVNRNTGEITDENNEPVWRYVDNRDWWVYGLNESDWTWNKLSEAKMDKDQLTYKDDSGNWVNYDAYWKAKDENMSKSWKSKSGDTKIKVSKDGDIKIKDENGKVKYDADDKKVKTDKDN
ncbi:MAG: hypothetical protein ACXWB9_00220 [Flavisolibacter sp.]